MWGQVDPIIDYKMRGLCASEYPNHPKGCPMLGCKEGCPPQAPLLGKHIDLEKPVFLIYTKFDLGAHMTKMLERHPHWTERQTRNVLYWQQGARKILKNEIGLFRMNEFSNWWITRCPEGHGLNVSETIKQLGITLDWPPTGYAYQVALAAHLKEKS